MQMCFKIDKANIKVKSNLELPLTPALYDPTLRQKLPS